MSGRESNAAECIATVAHRATIRLCLDVHQSLQSCRGDILVYVKVRPDERSSREAIPAIRQIHK